MPETHFFVLLKKTLNTQPCVCLIKEFINFEYWKTQGVKLKGRQYDEMITYFFQGEKLIGLIKIYTNQH